MSGILFDIENGDYDDKLAEIIEFAKKRMRSIPIKEGDTVRVSDNCSPKYMQGIVCTVVKTTSKQSRGQSVYLCRPVEDEHWKLWKTKMVKGYRDGKPIVSDIYMARDLIEKV